MRIVRARARLAPWSGFAVLLTVSACSQMRITGGGASRTVVFDQAHDQRFLIEHQGTLDLSGLAEIFRREGLQVTATSDPISEQTLANADALVSSGPFTAFQPAEIEAIVAFVQRGGRLCAALHIAPPAAALLGRLGVATSNGVIHETQNIIGENDLNFRVTRLRRHPITAGLSEFSAYGTWALINASADAEIIARTTSGAWIDLNGNGVLDEPVERPQAFGVAVAGEVGRGAFVVFGDDAIFQNQFLHDGNLALATNLARWLRGAGGRVESRMVTGSSPHHVPCRQVAGMSRVATMSAPVPQTLATMISPMAMGATTCSGRSALHTAAT